MGEAQNNRHRPNRGFAKSELTSQTLTCITHPCKLSYDGRTNVLGRNWRQLLGSGLGLPSANNPFGIKANVSQYPAIAHRRHVAGVMSRPPEVRHAVDFEDLHPVRQPLFAKICFNPLPILRRLIA